MGLFRRKRPDVAPVVEERMTLAEALLQSTGGMSWQTASGVDVGPDSALRNVAVFACVRVLCSEIAKLPVGQYRRTSGRRQEVTPSSVVVSPSGSVSQRGWIGQVVRSLVSSGNAYGVVTAADPLGRPTQIDTLSPAQVVFTPSTGFLVDGQPEARWPSGRLWHVAVSGLLPPGSPVALSPIQYAAESIGAGLAAERWGAQFFAGGGFPSVLMKSTLPKLTADQAEVAKQRVKQSAKRGEPFVLDGSWTVERFADEPSSMQYIDLLRFEVEQACRAFLVPPSMVFLALAGQNVTYANVTQADLHFLKHSIEHYLVDLEDAWSACLPQPQYVRFNTDAMLRMDKRARSEEHEIRLRTKTRTVNEVRLLEDEEPFDDPMYNKPGIPGGPEPEVAPSGGDDESD